MTRIVDVARLQLMDGRKAVGLPLGIMATVLALNVAIAFIASSGDLSTGGVSAIYVVVAIGQIQVITQFFPFALGLGVTRKEFYAAALLYALVQAMAFGLVLAAGLAIERATGGWGVGLGFFRFGAPENLLLAWLVFAAVLLGCSAVGLGFGVVFKRWGQLGVYAVLIGLAVVLVGAMAVIGWQGWWPQVFSALGDQPPAAAVVYPLLLALLVGGAGWLGLRRATP
ncbi:hypothetical protein [Pseudonocardia sp.]|uniref:hypothetical protein n=1 Tax=Pseudonocardia sp. TaxID=60912 RepID=UPI00260A7147|nr:hypothetical protein [Pseudonocardia sp.]